MSQQPGNPSDSPREVLKSSSDRQALEQAAISLAGSNDPSDLNLLGQFLRDAKFLARLDDPTNSAMPHFTKLMETLAEHPDSRTADLCLILADDPLYQDDARLSPLLDVLAAVKPMSARIAALFQRTNQEGYFGYNARLLAANGSPVALKLFESMILDKGVPIENRVECLHISVVPHRMEAPILRVADRIFSRTSERALANGVIESVFDFQQRWYGIESDFSAPPPWTSASPDSLRAALQLAEKAEARPGLSPSLHKKVASARETIAQALGQH
ncbi:MAG: hypothetical protein WB755_26425 [Terriglobales bacterium]